MLAAIRVVRERKGDSVPLNRKTILIVDDDEMILHVLERDLGQAALSS